ncbi:MAG TPA: BatA domain-containing protein [Pirellulaceae bacterium]|nr:BatA domain-containing protein [Pirellulaceae bacterium]
MSFIQIGFLAALAALAIPIIVHLVFRQRPKRVELGTLRFLRVVLEHNARRRRVMRWLLLALRLACVALLALLFARPYLLAYSSSGQKKTAVVLIDRSASMELKQEGVRAVERAVASVHELLGKAANNTRFEIAFFDHQVRPLVAPQPGEKAEGKRRDVSVTELASKLVAPAASYGGTDYGAALEWARDVLSKAPAGPRELHIYTDFQQSGLAWSEVDALPEDVAAHLHDLGRAAVNNVAVVEARVERSWLRPDEQTSIHVTVYNGGPFAADDVPIALKLTSQSRKLELREQVKVESGAMESVRLDLPPLAAGLWQGTVSVETEDDLPLDNQRHVALLASPPYQVLLIDGRASPSPVLSSTYFLDAALRLAPPGELYSASPFEPRQIAAGETIPNLDKYDVVVLSSVGDLSRRDADKILGLVERGGGLFVFCGDNVTAEKTTALETAGLSVGTITGIQEATDLPLRFKKWDAKHPIFAAFGDPQLGDLARLSFSTATKIEPAQGATVLAEFQGTLSAVIERRIGKGSVVWFTSSCDGAWGDWTRSRLYLPLVHQFLGYQSGLLAGGRVRYEVLEGPVELPADAVPGSFENERFTQVINSSPRESETDRSTVEEFVNRFGLKPSAETQVEVAAVPEEQTAAGSELIKGEFWHWLAMILVAGLVVEGLVANRTTA